MFTHPRLSTSQVDPPAHPRSISSPTHPKDLNQIKSFRRRHPIPPIREFTPRMPLRRTDIHLYIFISALPSSSVPSKLSRRIATRYSTEGRSSGSLLQPALSIRTPGKDRARRHSKGRIPPDHNTQGGDHRSPRLILGHKLSERGA